MVLPEDVKGLKVQELKDELKALGLDTKGVKADLLKRLEEALATKDVSQPAAEVPAVAATKADANEPAPAADGGETVANGRAPIQFKATAAAGAAEKPDGVAAPATAPSAATGTLSEVEKRKQRAERFGVEPSAADKAKLRAERFGLSKAEEGAPKAAASNGVNKSKSTAAHIVAKELTEAEKNEDLEKKKARAKRFNLPVPSSKEEEASKKKARAERFGSANDSGSKPDANKDELAAKLAARAERFAGASTTVPLTKSELDAKKEARAIRFATAK